MEYLNECICYYIERHPPKPLIEPDNSSNSFDDDDSDMSDPLNHSDDETLVDFKDSQTKFLSDPNSDPNMSPSHSY